MRYRALTLLLPADEAALLDAAHVEASARLVAAFQPAPSLDEFVRYVLHKGLGVVVGMAESPTAPLVELLRSLEWCAEGGTWESAACPSCGAAQIPTGKHERGCALDEAIRGA